MTSQKMCDCNQGRMACTCKPEEEHGLQASAAKQRIDAQAGAIDPKDLRIDTYHAGERSGFVHTCQTAVRITHLPTGVFVESKDERSVHKNKQRCMELLPAAVAAKPMPPAVGEFAVQEIDRLRARLAKYEDAEGRPVVAVNIADLAEDLRVNADAHPLDVRLQVMGEAADALESQAREIERLTSAIDSDKLRKMVAEARAELAALKAQPSGVVQWPDADEIMQMAFEEGQPSEDASGYYFELEEFDLFIQRLMGEVARLNSSPVTDNGAPE